MRKQTLTSIIDDEAQAISIEDVKEEQCFLKMATPTEIKEGRKAAEMANPTKERWLSDYGIQLLRYDAQDEFEAATGIVFPWQSTARSGEGAFGHDYSRWHRYRKITPEGHQKELEQAARYAGWLKAVESGKYPTILKVLKQGTSSRGWNSPYYHFDAESFFHKFHSPGGLERALRKAREEANEVLRPYSLNVQPMWFHVGHALLRNARPRRAGIIAAAMSLTHEKSRGFSPNCLPSDGREGDYTPSYKEARRILASLAMVRLTVFEPGGRRTATPILEDPEGYTLYSARIEKQEKNGLPLLEEAFWVVMPDGRQFFTPAPTWGWLPENGGYNTPGGSLRLVERMDSVQKAELVLAWAKDGSFDEKKEEAA